MTRKNGGIFIFLWNFHKGKAFLFRKRAAKRLTSARLFYIMKITHTI